MIWFEEVKERNWFNAVLMSNVRPATIEEVQEAYKNKANCQHQIIRDEAGWMYDFRFCVVCGQSLGTV